MLSESFAVPAFLVTAIHDPYLAGKVAFCTLIKDKHDAQVVVQVAEGTKSACTSF